MGKRRAGTSQSALGTGQSALGISQSALRTGHTALGTGQSALGTGQSALGISQPELGTCEIRGLGLCISLFGTLGHSEPSVRCWSWYRSVQFVC